MGYYKSYPAAVATPAAEALEKASAALESAAMRATSTSVIATEYGAFMVARAAFDAERKGAKGKTPRYALAAYEAADKAQRWYDRIDLQEALRRDREERAAAWAALETAAPRTRDALCAALAKIGRRGYTSSSHVPDDAWTHGANAGANATSRYFNLAGVRIRISDHEGKGGRASADVDIVGASIEEALYKIKKALLL